jgi:tetratricopeptide (TPR) repeat protein
MNKELKEIEELISTGKVQEALSRLSVLADKESNSTILIHIGDIYCKLQKMAKAMNCYLKVIDNDPDNKKAKNKISMISGILEYHYKDIYNP